MGLGHGARSPAVASQDLDFRLRDDYRYNFISVALLPGECWGLGNDEKMKAFVPGGLGSSSSNLWDELWNTLAYFEFIRDLNKTVTHIKHICVQSGWSAVPGAEFCLADQMHSYSIDLEV